MSVMLSVPEEQLLEELDRLVDWYEQNGQSLSRLHLTKTQFVMLKHIAEKTKQGSVIKRGGRIDLAEGTYRGLEVVCHEPKRRNYRRSDMESLVK